jgi:hypothetical protein
LDFDVKKAGQILEVLGRQSVNRQHKAVRLELLEKGQAPPGRDN